MFLDRNPASDIKISLTFEPAIGYAKFKEADPVGISNLSFEYTRYKIGEQKVKDGWSKNALTVKVNRQWYWPKHHGRVSNASINRL